VILADTSFLLSLEGNDTNSPVAAAHVATMNGPIAICELNRLEFENAISLLRFRKALTEKEASITLESFAADEAAGRIAVAPCDWSAVLSESLRLSRRYAEAGGHRLLDILHVAIAKEAKADLFLSFDKRQRELARAEGLPVGP